MFLVIVSIYFVSIVDGSQWPIVLVNALRNYMCRLSVSCGEVTIVNSLVDHCCLIFKMAQWSVDFSIGYSLIF